MINVGDKVKFKKYDETIYTVVNVEDEDVRVINNKGSQLMQISKDFIEVVEPYIDYKQRADELESLLYTHKENAKSIPDLIEQIQASNKRADRAEKRWSELKEDLTECSNDPLYEVHHRVRKDVKQVFVNILKKMCEFEEDSE